MKGRDNMSNLSNLMTKDFKVLMYLYENRGVGNIICVRQVDVGEVLNVNRTTIINSYKSLVALGYINHEGDVYFFTEQGLKVCKAYENLEKESEIIMYCTKCGKPIQEGWDFCKGCDNPVKVEKEIKDVPKPYPTKWKLRLLLGGRKGCVIDVVSPCIYLVHFIHAYNEYLNDFRGIKSRVLYIYESPWCEEKYKDLDSDNFIFVKSTDGKKIGKFLSEIVDNHIIVVEGMYNLETYGGFVGQNMKHLYAVNGLSDIKRFDLPANQTILTLVGTKNNIIIPRISNYAYMTVNGKIVETSNKVKTALYTSNCTTNIGPSEGSFIKLNKLLNIV